ncbi:MAG TPA: metal ABC transporter permease [Patescibacteria group bacterium]|nr:metal ABC transporter permease [Patescibacteria group bacterium]
MPEILQYSFMVRALLAGLIVAITVPVLGSFLVARRYSLIADSLAHVSLAGVGAGLLFGFAPVLVAVPVTVVGALLLEWMRQKRQVSGEVSLAILMSGGLALAVVLANFARGANTDFTSYLFGGIATTGRGDVITLAIAGLLVLGFVAANYRSLLHIAFDEDSARIAGCRVTLLNYALAAMTAIIVVLSLRIVGGLLMSALLVMPVVTASRFSRSFGQTILYAIIVAVIAVLAGLIVAFYAGVAAGGAIVLAALTLLIFAMIWKS